MNRFPLHFCESQFAVRYGIHDVCVCVCVRSVGVGSFMHREFTEMPSERRFYVASLCSVSNTSLTSVCLLAGNLNETNIFPKNGLRLYAIHFIKPVVAGSLLQACVCVCVCACL